MDAQIVIPNVEKILNSIVSAFSLKGTVDNELEIKMKMCMMALTAVTCAGHFAQDFDRGEIFF